MKKVYGSAAAALTDTSGAEAAANAADADADVATTGGLACGGHGVGQRHHGGVVMAGRGGGTAAPEFGAVAAKQHGLDLGAAQVDAQGWARRWAHQCSAVRSARCAEPARPALRR